MHRKSGGDSLSQDGREGRAAGSRNKATLALDAIGDEAAKEILEKLSADAKGGDIMRILNTIHGRLKRMAYRLVGKAPLGAAPQCGVVSNPAGENGPKVPGLVSSRIHSRRSAVAGSNFRRSLSHWS